jgi:GAF domain-containing protein
MNALFKCHAQVIAQSSIIEKKLDLTLEHILNQTSADAVDIFKLDKKTAQPVFFYGRGFGEMPSYALQYDSWKGLVWRVLQKRDLVSLPNIWVESSSLVRKTAFEQYRFISYQGIPLAINGKILGVLEIFHCQEFFPDSSWFELFRSLADQLSQTLDMV